MRLSINDAGLAILKEFEAGPQGNGEPALTPYLCPAGKLTIGWGHTSGVAPGTIIDRARAEEYLHEDLAEFCAVVDGAIGDAPTTDNQFAALVLLAFNIGTAGFLGSTPLRLHLAGKYTEAANSFALWRKMTDPNTGKLVDSPGLIRRRAAEAALYLKAPFQQPAMPQEVAAPKAATASKTVLLGAAGVVSGVGAVVDQADALREVVTNVTAATTSLGALKVALGALMSGKGVGIALTAVTVLCVAAVVWRYVLKARNGDVTVR